MLGTWQQLDNRSGQRRGPVRGHLGGFAMVSDRSIEEPGRGSGVAFPRNEYVYDLAVLIERSAHVPPGAGDLHAGLVNEPPVANSVATGTGSVNDQRGEPLHPSVQGGVVDSDAALSQQLLKVAIRQSKPQVPTYRQDDHLRPEPESGKGPGSQPEGSAERTALHREGLAF